MPGFAKIHSDREIWHLVHYVRSLAMSPAQMELAVQRGANPAR